jgi:hypothetical protein
MKYAVFAIMMLVGVPAMVWVGMTYRRGRELLIAALIASTCFGPLGKMNFVSIEAYRGPDRGFEVTLTDIIALAINIVLILKFSGKLKWMPQRTGLLVLMFLLCVFGVANSGVVLYSAFTLFKLLRMYNLFWCLVNVIEVGTRIEVVWQGYVAMGLIMTWLAIKQKYLNGMYRITGPFDAPNSIPLYVNVNLPLLLTWAIADKKLSPRKVFLTVFCVLGMLFCVIATASRAGMFLGALGLIFVMVVTTIRTPSRRSLTASAIFSLILIAGGIKTAGSIAKRVKDAPAASEQARVEFNEAAHAMLRDHPMGIGLNNFSWELTYHTEYRRYLVVMANEKEAGVCHHIYNLTAAELGWPGLFLYIVIMVSFVWMAFRASLLSKDLESQLLLGLMLGALALHLQGFLEWGFRITPVLQNFAISTGLVVGLANREWAKYRTLKKNNRRPITTPVASIA